MMALAERELTIPARDSEQDFTSHPYRWTREQFYQIGDMGLFEGRRAILIEGEILAMPAMKDPHRTSLTLVDEALQEAFGSGYFLSIQCPFDIGEATDPEPDIAVIRGGIRDYSGRGLTLAELIVEVSHSTLAYDRREKASLYAMAGMADYWIINIDQKPAQIEVHRQPVPEEAQPYGFGYREKTIHHSGEIIQPLNAPKPVAVAALLP